VSECSAANEEGGFVHRPPTEKAGVRGVTAQSSSRGRTKGTIFSIEVETIVGEQRPAGHRCCGVAQGRGKVEPASDSARGRLFIKVVSGVIGRNQQENLERDCSRRSSFRADSLFPWAVIRLPRRPAA